MKSISIYYGHKESDTNTRILSNLAERRFLWEGNEYGSVEHAYQVLKNGCINNEIDSRYKQIKGYGKKIRNTKPRNKNFDNLKLMEDLVLESFKQNPDIAKELLKYDEYTHPTDNLIDRHFLKGIYNAKKYVITELKDSDKEIALDYKNAVLTELPALRKIEYRHNRVKCNTVCYGYNKDYVIIVINETSSIRLLIDRIIFDVLAYDIGQLMIVGRDNIPVCKETPIDPEKLFKDVVYNMFTRRFNYVNVIEYINGDKNDLRWANMIETTRGNSVFVTFPDLINYTKLEDIYQSDIETYVYDDSNVLVVLSTPNDIDNNNDFIEDFGYSQILIDQETFEAIEESYGLLSVEYDRREEDDIIKVVEVTDDICWLSYVYLADMVIGLNNSDFTAVHKNNNLFDNRLANLELAPRSITHTCITNVNITGDKFNKILTVTFDMDRYKENQLIDDPEYIITDCYTDEPTLYIFMDSFIYSKQSPENYKDFRAEQYLAEVIKAYHNEILETGQLILTKNK